MKDHIIVLKVDRVFMGQSGVGVAHRLRRDLVLFLVSK